MVGKLLEKKKKKFLNFLIKVINNVFDFKNEGIT